MTVADLSPVEEYIEDGVSLNFAAPFRFLSATDLEVSRIVAGVETVLAYGAQWSAAGGSTDAGGTVTLVASTAGAALRIRRRTARSQGADYATGDRFPAETHEGALDRAMLISQEQDVDLQDLGARGFLAMPGQAGLSFDRSNLADGDILQFSGGKLQRLDRAAFAGRFYGGDASGKLVPLTGTGSDAALRTDLANASAGARLVADADGVPLQDRINREPLQVDSYYDVADGTDWAPAWTRVLAAARLAGRSVRATAGRSYNLASAIEIWPGVLGQTPWIYVDGNTFILDTVDAGFRYRGLKSGADANPAFGGIVGSATIDHNNLDTFSGTRGIGVENGGGLLFDGVNGVNVAMGYHILNMRYADGGAINGAFEARNFTVSGTQGNPAPALKWYGFSDTCDLTIGKVGDVVGVGQTVAIATAQEGSASYDMPNVANLTNWTNNTAGAIVIPAGYSQAALTAAGLTIGTTTLPIGGVEQPLTIYYYYNSAGTLVADAVERGKGRLQNYEVDGGYYGGYLQGVDEYEVRNIRTDNTVRGFSCEWNAQNVAIVGARIRETVSSGVLFGYGCPDCSVDFLEWKSASTRWIGEAVVNVQLASPRFRLGTARMECTGTTTSGQYFIKFSMASGDFRVEGPVKIKGDCAKAYLAVESAWNYRLSGTHLEHYPQSSLYDGGAQADMKGGLFDNITIEQTSTASDRGTCLSIMQVADEIHGEVGLGIVTVRRLRTNSLYFRKYIKIYDGAAAAKAMINKIRLEDCEFNPLTVPATAATKYELPRKWAHFQLVRNVTNLDDDYERAVPDVATPDLTFGTHWVLSGATALSGVLGAQGADSTQAYDNRRIFIRGNGARTMSTISGVSGTRDGLRLRITPITLAATDKRHLVYNKANISWIEI